MIELIPPHERVRKSFIEAMGEFQSEGRGGISDTTMIGREIRRYGDQWHDPEVFAGFTAQLRAGALEESPRPAGFVPSTTLWLVDGDEYLGRVAIRHRLTPFLLETGGHIGYDVRPSARNRGHATTMLRGALAVAETLGIDQALVTCDVTNPASRRVIEKCGGVLEDERNGKLRFWIGTGGIRAAHP